MSSSKLCPFSHIAALMCLLFVSSRQMTDFMWFIVSGDLIKCSMFLWDITDNRKQEKQKLLLHMCVCVCQLFETHFQFEVWPNSSKSSLELQYSHFDAKSVYEWNRKWKARLTRRRCGSILWQERNLAKYSFLYNLQFFWSTNLIKSQKSVMQFGIPQQISLSLFKMHYNHVSEAVWFRKKEECSRHLKVQ